ncbi:MAG: type II secretion system GspH family protein [Clostridiales bacterium]|jgi:prepilin-type N-terminal cleavage/methylation domain-containing protein|nr:type II secretion system GspH family protein [Clostridiales bacterium]
MKKPGFTLIELIIVMAVIGILTSIMVANFRYPLHKTRLQADVQSARALTSAAILYEMDEGEKLSGADILSDLKAGGYIDSDYGPQTGGDFVLDGDIIKVDISGLPQEYQDAYDKLTAGEQSYVKKGL